MGIFDSEYQYAAFSQTQPLIEDKDKRDTLGTFVVSAARHDDEDMVPNIIAATQAGLPGLANHYFKYGENKYYWGLPESNFTQFNVSEDDIKRAITLGSTGGVGSNVVTLERVFIPIDSAKVEAIKWLNKQSWYDVGKKENWIPDRYQGHAGTIDPLEFTAKREQLVNKHWLTIEAKITWHGPVDQYAPKFWTKRVEISNSTMFKTGLWAIYSRPSGSRPPTLGQEWHWPLRYSYVNYYPSAAFPESPISSTKSKFYPISVFWRDHLTYHSNDQWNKTLKGLLLKLNVQADDIFDSFVEALHNSGANNVNLIDFFIGFFVRLDTTFNKPYTDSNVRYVFELVKQLYQVRGFGRDVYEAYLKRVEEASGGSSSGGGTGTGPGTGLGPFTSTGSSFVRPPEYRMYVSEGNTPGVGGGFNFIFSWSLIEQYESTISHAHAESKFVQFQYAKPGSRHGSWVRGITYLPNNTELYESYLLVNPESKYIVNTKDGARSAKPEGGIWCPVSHDLLKELPFKDKERILQDGLCSVVYTVTKEEIKWYQSTFWKGMFIIITVATLGILSVVGIAGVLGAMGLTATAGFSMFTLAGYILQFAVGFLVQFAVNLNIDNPIIAGIVASLLTMGIGGIHGTGGAFSNNFNTAFANLTNVLSFEATSAIGLVSKINNFRSAYIQMEQMDDLEQMQEDMTLMSETERQEALEAAYSGLSTNLIDPHMELNRRLNMDGFETPEEFHNRTVKFNPGAELMEIPSKFVDLSLQLPRGIKNS